VCIVGAGGEDTAGSPPWRLIRMPWGMGDRSAALGGSLGCLELIIQGIQRGGNLIGGEDQLGLEIGPVDRGVAALDDQPAGCRINITQVILVETDASHRASGRDIRMHIQIGQQFGEALRLLCFPFGAAVDPGLVDGGIRIDVRDHWTRFGIGLALAGAVDGIEEGAGCGGPRAAILIAQQIGQGVIEQILGGDGQRWRVAVGSALRRWLAYSKARTPASGGTGAGSGIGKG
jgi:hypothetical protein